MKCFILVESDWTASSFGGTNPTNEDYAVLKELIESELLPNPDNESVKALIEEIPTAAEKESHPWEAFKRAPLLPIYEKLCSRDASSLTAQEGMTIVSIMIPEMVIAKLQLSSPDEFGSGCRDRNRLAARQKMNALTSAFGRLLSDPEA